MKSVGLSLAQRFLIKDKDNNKDLCLDFSNLEMIDISRVSPVISSFDNFGSLNLKQNHVSKMRKFMNDLESLHGIPVSVKKNIGVVSKTGTVVP